MKIGNKKIRAVQVARLLIQITFFIFLPALYIQALNGVRVVYTAIINQNVGADVLPQMVEILVLIPFTIIVGRFFCGWMCGFSSFLDFIHLIFQKVLKRKFQINSTADAILKYVKFIILAILIIFAWSLDFSIFNKLSPWDVFGMVAIVGNVPDFGYVLTNLTIASVFFVLIMIGSIFIERFFCRYLCPMGAIFAICSFLRIGKIKKPTEKCGKCRVCTNNCAMGIPLYKSDVVKSIECINCMKCVSTCPRKNVSYTIAKKDVQPLLVSAASVAVMTSCYYTVSYAMDTSGISSVVSESSSTSTAKTYADGIYQGSGTGFRGTTTVSVTIKDDKITNITTVSHRDDSKYYDRAYSTVTKGIISKQSTAVDSVSGATYSSKGIMQAVENALSQAKDALLTSNATESTTASTATTASTSSGSTSSNSTDNSSASSSTTNSKTTTSTTAATSTDTGKYTDGTYTGSGTGFRGTTKVSVVVSGGKIMSVTTVSTKDDSKYYNRAYSTISSKIVSSQSANVDTVSGATYSSKGIIEAAKNALSSAVK